MTALVDAGLLTLKLAPAIGLALAGATKIAAPTHAASSAPRPSPLAPRLWTPAVLGLGVTECALAIVVVLWSHPAAAALVVLVMAALTAYGVWAIRSSGSCGCAGLGEAPSVRALVVRNLLLASAAAVGILGAPSVATLAEEPQGAVLGWVALGPAVVLAGIAVVRFAQAHQGHTRQRGTTNARVKRLALSR